MSDGIYVKFTFNLTVFLTCYKKISCPRTRAYHFLTLLFWVAIFLFFTKCKIVETYVTERANV